MVLNCLLDWKVGDYAQGPKTQLQFCFECTKPRARYPLGVKVRYRKFAADKAVVLERDDTYPHGVPLTAYVVHSNWHEMNGKGFSFFAHAIPDDAKICPVPFRANSAVKFNKVLAYVKSKFELEYYHSWLEFGKRFPKSDDSQEYVATFLQGNMYIPFKRLMFDAVTIDREAIIAVII